MSASHPQQLLAWSYPSSFILAVSRLKIQRSFQFVAVLVAISIISGCSSEPPRLPVFPVTGKVTFKGQPADGAQVFLIPVSTANGVDFAPSARVQKDGTFAITAYDSGDGAPDGDYVATVSWRKAITDKNGAVAGSDVIPKQYGSPLTSPVKVSVKGAPTQIPLIAIK